VSQNDDFISFEKALRDLKMQSEELKKLVSEGEIRAFRDGDSMKFKREDLESLRREEEEELVFADTLEDDTGMVTEELSEEDTLLAEDDDLVTEEAPRARTSGTVRTTRSARARIEGDRDDSKEPGWVTAAAVLTSVALVLGFMVTYKIAMESPGGVFGLFASQ